MYQCIRKQIHALNNALSIIMASAEIMALSDRDAKDGEYLDAILDASDRLRDISNEMVCNLRD